MARDIMRAWVHLDRLHCYDEADGWGNAEPYLWTVFFKADGTTLTLNDSFTLDGSAMIYPTPGSHGNLNTSDVDAGDDVPVPEAIGSWTEFIRPIPVAPSAQPLVGEDLPGFFGVVAVLMEEDNVTDDGAAAGHQALNDAVQAAIDQVIHSLGPMHQAITEDDINSVTAGIGDAVSAAIRAQQNFFEDLWSWLNADDEIGDRVFVWNQDQFPASSNEQGFSQRWQSEGDWELFGGLTVTRLCPATVAADLIHALLTGRSSTRADDAAFHFDPGAMRAFRDTEFGRWPGLAAWWKLAALNTPALATALRRDSELRGSAAAVLAAAAQILARPSETLPDAFLDHVERALVILARSKHRRLATDASRATEVVPLLRRKTFLQTVDFLNRVRPARHPRGAGETLRLQVRSRWKPQRLGGATPEKR
jgi:hypothetical protein